MAEYISDVVHYDQNIFDETLVELDKLVKVHSDKSIKAFRLPIILNFNSDMTSDKYRREVSNVRSILLQIVVQYKHRPEESGLCVIDQSINGAKEKYCSGMIKETWAKYLY